MRVVRTTILAVLVAAFALPAPAVAGTVSSSGGEVRFQAGAGEVNQVGVVVTTEGDIAFADGQRGAEAGPGCTKANPDVRCPRAGVTRIVIDLADSSDLVALGMPANAPSVTINGGDGLDTVNYASGPAVVSLDGAANDGPPGRGDNVLPDVENITGSLWDDSFTGNDLANVVEALAGRDTISTAGGDDVVDARDFVDCESEIDCPRPDPDTVACGDGFDIVDAETIDTVAADCEMVARNGRIVGTNRPDRIAGFRKVLTIVGRGGADRISGAGSDELEGGSGDDVLRSGPGGESVLRGGSGNDIAGGSSGRDDVHGDSGNDRLLGRANKDEIDGGTGRDTIYAGSGNDFVIAKDRGASRDRVSCGLGRDIVVVDRNDRVRRDCERVLTRAPRRGR